jgi:MFS family permease
MSVLAHPRCRQFFTGQALSLVGTWMSQAAVLWVAYQLMPSPFYLGLISFIEQIPNFVLVPLTGGVVEQSDRRRILLLTQTLFAIYAFALALLVLNQGLTWSLLLGLSLFKGVVNAFDVTARQVFIAEIVDRPEELPEAIGLNALIISASRFVGPAIAGILIAQAGTATCFVVDGLSYGVVIVALWGIRPHSSSPAQEYIPPWERFRLGWRYLQEHPEPRSVLILLAIVGFWGASYPTLTPIFAKEVFQGGSDTMGYLLAFAGLGSLLGSLAMLLYRDRLRRESLLLLSTAGLGIGLMGFGQSQILWLSLWMMVVIGACLVIHVSTSNILLHTLVNNYNRGIVLSLFTVAYAGITPFGNILLGELASKIGSGTTLTINGLLCLVSCWTFQTMAKGVKN